MGIALSPHATWVGLRLASSCNMILSPSEAQYIRRWKVMVVDSRGSGGQWPLWPHAEYSYKALSWPHRHSHIHSHIRTFLPHTGGELFYLSWTTGLYYIGRLLKYVLILGIKLWLQLKSALNCQLKSACLNSCILICLERSNNVCMHAHNRGIFCVILMKSFCLCFQTRINCLCFQAIVLPSRLLFSYNTKTK